MKPKILAFSNIAAALSLTILTFAAASPANAQATRTWVSGVGDDANPCSRTAPCKTFAGAISKTAAKGEINVLDPGGFGGVTITKAITIRSDHVEAGVLVSGTNAIIVNAGANDDVTLEGLDIEGLGTGLDGVRILAGKTVYVLRCAIRHFAQNGINLISSTPNSRLTVKDTLIYLNGTGAATAGGINIKGNLTNNVATLIDTVVDANANFDVKIDGNTTNNTGAANNIALVRTILSGSPQGLNLLNGASGDSFGPSSVLGGASSVPTPHNFQ